MKYISFSFDDGRADTYEIAKPIMDKYGFKASVNVISDFVFHPDQYNIESASRSMTPEQIIDWQKWGGEVASHSNTHKNSLNDIIRGIGELAAIGVDVSNIGFASPGSWLTEDNCKSTRIIELLESNKVSYLRSGIQIKREGLMYAGLSIIEQITHNKSIYYHLNKNNIIKNKSVIYMSAAVKDYNSVAQLKHMVNKLGNNDALIFMFHSILNRNESMYGKGHYYWDADKFDHFCLWLKEQNELSVVTVRNLVKIIESRKSN